MPKNVSATTAELEAQKRLSELDIDINSMLAISDLFRITNAIKYTCENTLLKRHGISFSGFTVLWVLWVWGAKESKYLAQESGISKGTLTGVAKTLQNAELISSRMRKSDGRKILIELTQKGHQLMQGLFPEYNRFETEISKNLSQTEKANLIRMLRILLHTIADDL